MKLQQLAMLVAAGLFSTITLAAGYTGPGAAGVTTVKAAMDASDDTPVVLEGKITKRIKGDIYEFQDATGSMKVEIDDEDWPAADINHITRVKLFGEVDRDLIGREIDVERVELIQ
ncbi:Bacterial OB fold (BOF) protein [compost metagenome]